ncbi:hypothetical protein BBK36DRAFT_1159376 [Trichoderma citrinoviride]|uniref:Uncharacterized protein n=1 Tax=Trichoderma citrinoviride TaxID=58853 RepID=A0A2T4BAJ0_9HYPO|nr:hypothetical protein BBK36DRAFT_1159376 [Trichoderma citrinoviride]PTB66337.1 hypothetical protein BBK36DRAFT_1159376 [Trichoderma citrinoviride]
MADNQNTTTTPSADPNNNSTALRAAVKQQIQDILATRERDPTSISPETERRARFLLYIWDFAPYTRESEGLMDLSMEMERRVMVDAKYGGEEEPARLRGFNAELFRVENGDWLASALDDGVQQQQQQQQSVSQQEQQQQQQQQQPVTKAQNATATPSMPAAAATPAPPAKLSESAKLFEVFDFEAKSCETCRLQELEKRALSKENPELRSLLDLEYVGTIRVVKRTVKRKREDKSEKSSKRRKTKE